MSVWQGTARMRKALWLCTLPAALAMAGCVVGPNYVPPKAPTPDTWHSQLQDGLVGGEVDAEALTSWWATLDDPVLSGLIERAVAGNLDLKQAWARVREARARRKGAQGAFFPTLDSAASATWSTSGAEGVRTVNNETYAANFDAGWELDLFGGIRRSVEAAQANLEASDEDLRDTLVSLLAETALNYVEVRTFQARLAAAEASLKTQEETYQLTVWRSQAGLGDELAAQQAKYNLENTRSQVPSLQTGLEEAMNRVAVLLGEPPGQVHAELARAQAIPVPPAEVAVGVPADVIRRRPDIRRAERNLAAQNARVGVATADLYPQLRLSGSIGLEALSLEDLASGSWFLSGGPRLTLPLFNTTIRPNIEVQSALQEQALLQYEAAVLNALEEVENALVAYAQEQRRRENLREATKAAQAAAELAQYKYQAGLTDFSNVLDAERSLLSFQDQLQQSDGTVTSNLIRLYKALGGGWTSTAVASASGEAGQQH
ncbi:MAG: efflux transporter outer membrane subunit [Sedimentisphaerales bacterium]|nr:efflux transporter outer membrane subunit [Sedimentisphaerales bacterium]